MDNLEKILTFYIYANAVVGAGGWHLSSFGKYFEKFTNSGK